MWAGKKKKQKKTGRVSDVEILGTTKIQLITRGGKKQRRGKMKDKLYVRGCCYSVTFKEWEGGSLKEGKSDVGKKKKKKTTQDKSERQFA